MISATKPRIQTLLRKLSGILVLSMVAVLLLPNMLVIAADSPEIVSLRTETSKTYALGEGQRKLVASIGAIHYKDDYTDSIELWKDIDLTWEGNKITKAPYELTLNGKEITLKNKKTGEVSTIELLDIGGQVVPSVVWQKLKGSAKVKDVALDTDLEVVAEFSRVKFTRILKSDKAPLEAKFKVTGDFIVSAEDTEGKLPVNSTLKDGILTETLNPDRAVKYPVRIDPTWQVGASSDDAWRRLVTPVFSLVFENIISGARNATQYQYGAGMRFTNIAIPQGATIDNGTHLTLRGRISYGGTVVRTRISAEDVDNAPTFANDAGAFDTRWAARTTARVNWDNIPSWATDTDYDSPEIKTVVQEIVDRPGWASGQDMVIFWEDFEDRSDHNTSTYRDAYSYDGSAEFAPKLVITFTVLSAVTTNVATSLTSTEATLHGEITDTGGDDSTVTFFWGLSDGVITTANWDNSSAPDSPAQPQGVAVFYLDISGLERGTTYYFNTRSVNVVGTSWGTTSSFATPQEAGVSILQSLLRVLVAGVILVGAIRLGSKGGVALFVSAVIGIIAFVIVDAFIQLL